MPYYFCNYNISNLFLAYIISGSEHHHPQILKWKKDDLVSQPMCIEDQ